MITLIILCVLLIGAALRLLWEGIKVTVPLLVTTLGFIVLMIVFVATGVVALIPLLDIFIAIAVIGGIIKLFKH